MEEALKLKRATYHLWTFVASKLISSFGAQVYAFAISFYILQMTGSATSFATNLICSILPRTLLAPFVGYVADNYSRKAIVILAQIGATIAIGGLLVVSLATGLSLIAIYATTIVLSITSTFSGIAFSSSVTGLIDEKRIQKAMSMNQMSVSAAAIGSPAVGGLLYGVVSMSTFLVIYLIASMIAVLLESTMNFQLFAKRKEVVAREKKESMFQSMKAGLSYVRGHSILVVMIWISLLVNFLFGAFEVGYAYVLIEKLKILPQHFGFTEGALAVGMLLLSIYMSVRKEVKFPFLVSKRGILIFGLLVMSVAIPLIVPMGYAVMVGFYMVVMFSLGATVVVVNTPIMVLMQKTIDDDYKGRVFSIVETMAMALMPLGMVIYGFLYDLIPAEWILTVSGLLLIFVVLILARPSVVRKAHPELVGNQTLEHEVSSTS